MKANQSLEGHSAVVTGGGRGIGEAIAEQLAIAGAKVVVAARSSAQIESVAQRLRTAGHEVQAVTCDVTEPEQISALRSAAERHFGTIDILINNAGIATSAPLAKVTLEDWEQMFRVNVTGVFLTTQAFVPKMVENSWGRVINVASVAGKFGAAYISSYAASKHAVVGFTRAMAAELATREVTVNAVCPGFVETEMTDESVARIVGTTGLSADQARSRLAKMSPQKRLYTSAEVAFQVVHLCRPESSGVNGQSIVIDGGGFQA